MKKILPSALVALFFITSIANTQAAYDPTIGRWLSRDPLPDAERLQGPNLFEYCRNGPIRYNDPTGTIIPVIPLAILTIGALGVEVYAEANTCANLSNGQTTYITTPISLMANFSGIIETGAQVYYDGPVKMQMKISKDNCGKCHATLVASPLFSPGA